MTETTRARGAARAVFGALPRVVTHARRNPPPENVALYALLVLTGLLLLGGLVVSESLFSPSTQVVPLLLGGLLLGREAMRRLMVCVGLCLLWDVLDLGVHGARPGGVVAVVVTGLIAYEFARSRDETGLGGLRGDTVLVELRRRLELQGALPPLALPWQAEAVLRPAGGGPFAGDFLVSACHQAERRLDAVLVDVSGKGVEAGARALLLSGALGGLLEALPPQEFLPAANQYLYEQDWDEGFATAVHLTVDLGTGKYVVASAGHPPPAHLDAGSGRWSLHELAGPALGLVPGASYDVQHGVLNPGDALILYTDGLVETPGRDLSVGIDKLLGAAEHLVARGFVGGAEQLVETVAGQANDDRGLLLLWRGR